MSKGPLCQNVTKKSKRKCPKSPIVIFNALCYKKSRSERIPHAGSYGLLLKIMVFSPFKHEITYQRVSNDDVHSSLENPLTEL